MIETKNAKITSTMLGLEDHGILSFMLHLDYGNGVHQGAGGYALDEPLRDVEEKFLRRVGTAHGMELINQVLKVTGVDRWEKLAGQHIRVRCDNHKVYAIGNLLEDNWLDFKKFFEEE